MWVGGVWSGNGYGDTLLKGYGDILLNPQTPRPLRDGCRIKSGMTGLGCGWCAWVVRLGGALRWRAWGLRCSCVRVGIGLGGKGLPFLAAVGGILSPRGGEGKRTLRVCTRG